MKTQHERNPYSYLIVPFILTLSSIAIAKYGLPETDSYGSFFFLVGFISLSLVSTFIGIIRCAIGLKRRDSLHVPLTILLCSFFATWSSAMPPLVTPTGYQFPGPGWQMELDDNTLESYNIISSNWHDNHGNLYMAAFRANITNLIDPGSNRWALEAATNMAGFVPQKYQITGWISSSNSMQFVPANVVLIICDQDGRALATNYGPCNLPLMGMTNNWMFSNGLFPAKMFRLLSLEPESGMKPQAVWCYVIIVAIPIGAAIYYWIYTEIKICLNKLATNLNKPPTNSEIW